MSATTLATAYISDADEITQEINNILPTTAIPHHPTITQNTSKSLPNINHYNTTAVANPPPQQRSGSPITITNQAICSFYDSNPHISIESVNLLVLDLLKQGEHAAATDHWSNAFNIAHHPNNKMGEETRRMEELKQLHNQLKDGVHNLILHISSKFSDLKIQYIQEFKSALNIADRSKQWTANNHMFMDKTKQLFADILKIHQFAIAEKTQNMLRQFTRILNTNLDTILNTANNESDDGDKMRENYLYNFELNATHMVNSVFQLITDCVSQKEAQITQYIERPDSVSPNLTAAYYRLVYELTDLHKQLHSDYQKTAHNSHNELDYILSQSFPTSYITTEIPSIAYTISRENGVQHQQQPHSDIYIETHDYRDRNINTQEIKDFCRKIDERNTNGILISQYTGITSKPNYYIEIQNNRVIVYLHQMEWSPDKMQIAVDMVYSLSAKLSECFIANDQKYSVPKDILDDINREYQQYITQKETIISLLKDQHKTMLTHLDDMRFCSLDKYLSTRYSSCRKQGYTCDLCNIFNVGTLKGLAAHKRGCIRKRNVNDCANVALLAAKPCRGGEIIKP